MALKILINVTRHYVEASRGPRILTSGRFRTLLVFSPSQRLLCHNGERKMAAEPSDSEVGIYNKKHKPSDSQKALCRQRLNNFLMKKGASKSMAEAIISRYPKAILSPAEEVGKIWELWKSVLETDSALLHLVDRSPESFFRSGDVKKLSENLAFLESLGLPPNIIKQIMIQSPRTFANTVKLNKDRIGFFQELCTHLGAAEPKEFIIDLISTNIFIFTRSNKRVQANVMSIKSLMKLENEALLSFIRGSGAPVLNLCNTYLEENYLYIQQRMKSLGISEEEVTRCIYENPQMFLTSPKVFDSKLSLLASCGIDAAMIMNNPKLLNVSYPNLVRKVQILQELGYDFKDNGVDILTYGSSVFDTYLRRFLQPNKTKNL